MSKADGLPGLRIGWLSCRDRTLLDQFERRTHYTSICSAGPGEARRQSRFENGEPFISRTAASSLVGLAILGERVARSLAGGLIVGYGGAAMIVAGQTLTRCASSGGFLMLLAAARVGPGGHELSSHSRAYVEHRLARQEDHPGTHEPARTDAVESFPAAGATSMISTVIGNAGPVPTAARQPVILDD